MLFRDDGAPFFSSFDLLRAVNCEWAFVRKLDEVLGHMVVSPSEADSLGD
jgi:hypothetical protein